MALIIADGIVYKQTAEGLTSAKLSECADEIERLHDLLRLIRINAGNPDAVIGLVDRAYGSTTAPGPMEPTGIRIHHP